MWRAVLRKGGDGDSLAKLLVISVPVAMLWCKVLRVPTKLRSHLLQQHICLPRVSLLRKANHRLKKEVTTYVILSLALEISVRGPEK